MEIFLTIIKTILGLLILIIPFRGELLKEQTTPRNFINKLFKGKTPNLRGKFLIVIFILFGGLQIYDDINNHNYKIDSEQTIGLLKSVSRKSEQKLDSVLQITSSTEIMTCRALKIIEESNKDNYEYLISKYPTGYLLIYQEFKSEIGRSQFNLSRGSTFNKNYDFNYDDVKISYAPEVNEYNLLFPKIINKTYGYLHMEKQVWGIKLRENYIDRFPIVTEPDYIYFEILSLNNSEIVYCIGFRDQGLPKLEGAP